MTFPILVRLMLSVPMVPAAMFARRAEMRKRQSIERAA
jgi:hypothetical protein